jgi:hypothetical protein
MTDDRNKEKEATGYTVAEYKECDTGSDDEQCEMVGDEEPEAAGDEEPEAVEDEKSNEEDEIRIKNSLIMASQPLQKIIRLIQEDLGIFDDCDNCDTVDIMNDLSGGLLVSENIIRC